MIKGSRKYRENRYYEQSMIWLLIYVLTISLYDLHTCRIPNWYTFPLIAAGLIMHFPGRLDLWLGVSL